jgi:hypothetical protein
MFAIFLFTAFLVIRTTPDTFLGKALRRGLVDWPAARLSRLTRGQIVCWLGLGLGIGAAVAMLGGDALPIVGGALPDTIAWAATFDISILADVLVAAVLVATQARLRGVAESLRARLGAAVRRAGPRPRAPRRPRSSTPKADNDDADGPAFALARAA